MCRKIRDILGDINYKNAGAFKKFFIDNAPIIERVLFWILLISVIALIILVIVFYIVPLMIKK